MLVICSTHCGPLTCSWNVFKTTLTGPSSVQTSALDCKTLTVMSSRNCITRTKHKAWLARLSLLEKFGTRLLKHKSRPVRRTCSTRMLQISSRTRRIWEPFALPTSVLRLWSTPPLTKSLSATSHPSLYQSTSRTVRSITISSSMSPTMQRGTSTESSM